MPKRQHPNIDKKRSKQRPTGAVTSAAKPETGKEEGSRPGLWKIIVGALVGLLLSAGFISAAIPKYKLRITAPVVKKDNLHQAQLGSVTIRWMISKEQWFREVDVAGVKANVTLKKSGEEDQHFRGSRGEVTLNLLQPGTYEVNIDALELGRSETIALEVSADGSGTKHETAELTGIVVDQDGNLIQGAKVTIDEMPGMEAVETASNAVFMIKDVPKKYFERVRIRVIKDGYLPNPYTDDVVIGGTPPRVPLRREK